MITTAAIYLSTVPIFRFVVAHCQIGESDGFAIANY